jgi:hypothetical protein
LKSLGIPVIVDLPTVGENLQVGKPFLLFVMYSGCPKDHLGVGSVFRLRDPSTITLGMGIDANAVHRKIINPLDLLALNATFAAEQEEL